MEEYTLVDNTHSNQYEFHMGRHIARILYKKNSKREIHLLRVEVPVELEGQGIASALVEKALRDIEKQKLRVVPLCSFIESYICRHPEWNKLMEP